jgi:3alpha(or 20beta)-hydroxysteroid dehydrogenase
MSRLNGKVALVSGGARGIGAAIARAMVVEGAKVVMGDVLDTEGQALAQEIGPPATYVHLDVTKPNDWEAAVATAVTAYGKLNVLVNNAGLANHAVNLTGVFNGIKAAVPELKNAAGGSIINISSIAGSRSVTRFGVRQLTKAAALDLGQYGIQVNSVHPGLVRIPMSATEPQPGTSHVAMDCGGDPAEIARLVVFLASDESSFSTGLEFIANGGETAGPVLNLPMKAASKEHEHDNLDGNIGQSGYKIFVR